MSRRDGAKRHTMDPDEGHERWAFYDGRYFDDAKMATYYNRQPLPGNFGPKSVFYDRLTRVPQTLCSEVAARIDALAASSKNRRINVAFGVMMASLSRHSWAMNDFCWLLVQIGATTAADVYGDEETHGTPELDREIAAMESDDHFRALFRVYATNAFKTYGLDGWTFEWVENQAFVGFTQQDKRTISMSSRWASLGLTGRDWFLLDTLAHELAHAMSGSNEHGESWAAQCAFLHWACDPEYTPREGDPGTAAFVCQKGCVETRPLTCSLHKDATLVPQDGVARCLTGHKGKTACARHLSPQTCSAVSEVWPELRAALLHVDVFTFVGFDRSASFVEDALRCVAASPELTRVTLSGFDLFESHREVLVRLVSRPEVTVVSLSMCGVEDNLAVALVKAASERVSHRTLALDLTENPLSESTREALARQSSTRVNIKV